MFMIAEKRASNAAMSGVSPGTKNVASLSR